MKCNLFVLTHPFILIRGQSICHIRNAWCGNTCIYAIWQKKLVQLLLAAAQIFFSRTKSSIYGIYSSISWRGWWYLLIAIFISIVLARVEWWWRIWEPFKQTEACSSIEQQLYKWHITQRRENVIFLPKSNFYGPLCCRYISVVFVQKRLIS